MDVSVLFLLLKTWVRLEIIASRVLQNQSATFAKKIFCKDFLWNCIKTFDVVWRICENKVKIYLTDLDKIENIVPYHLHTFYTKFCSTLLDEAGVKRVHLDRVDLRATA